MQLKLLLCFLLVLPVTLANCVDDYKRTLFLIGRLRQYATDNLEWVCGQDSREQIIQYMIKMLEELFLRLQLPCFFTFSPQPFLSDCPDLDTVNNLKFLVLLNQINLFLNSMCNLGCPMNMAQLLQTVLEDIEWLKTL